MVQPEDQQLAVSGGDAWRRFQAEIAQCWIAEAIAHVCARAVAVRLTQSHALVALRASPAAAVAAAQDARAVDAFANICALTTRFQQLLGVNGGDHGSPQTVPDVGAFAQWLRIYHERLEEQRYESRTCLVVLYALSVTEAATQALEEAIHAVNCAHGMRTIVLVIANPIGLLDVRGPSESFSRCVLLLDSKASNQEQQSTASYRNFLLRPLKQLSVQCGWRFVLEIAKSAVFCPRDAAAVTSSTSSPSLFTSLSQLPFQLMLLVLRWSHFHPRLVDALAKPFERKLRLIPQVRIRDAVARLQRQQLALWSDLYPTAKPLEDGLLSLSLLGASSTMNAMLDIPTRDNTSFQKLERVAQCHLWQVQKQFYLQQGINAWSDGIIPFGVSSSSFLAATYARE
jgi:hypothetical protein